jgi:thymidine phosphorylase
VQLGAGIELRAQLGDRVQAGDVLMTLHTDQPERFGRALQSLEGAVEYGDQAMTRTLIHQRIQ